MRAGLKENLSDYVFREKVRISIGRRIGVKSSGVRIDVHVSHLVVSLLRELLLILVFELIDLPLRVLLQLAQRLGVHLTVDQKVYKNT